MSPETPSVAQLVDTVNSILAALHCILGPRSTAILMVGVPIQDSEHDRFAAHYYGPCLSSRGLLEWGSRQVLAQIDAQDSSRNGKPHP